MASALFWLSDTEWAKIEPLMPRGRRGAHRVDDRRVISGIVLLADKAYDTNPLRAILADKGIEPIIPSIRRRKPLIPYDVHTYRQRNPIERMFGRLKDFRRVATRYDKLARNFFATAILAATLIWWLN
jgi:putative transposase